MRLINLGIIFSILFCALVVTTDQKVRELSAWIQTNNLYNETIDAALEAAMSQLVEVDMGGYRKINKEEAANTFFEYLSMGFNVQGSEILKERLKRHVPVVAILLDRGFYVYYDRLLDEQDEHIVEKTFSECYPYIWEDECRTYYFTMTEYIKIQDKESGEIYEGFYTDLSDQVDIKFLKSKEKFELKRRSSIIECITKELGEYVYNHNDIARKYGIDYTFSFPVTKKDDFHRSIDGISMIALFQGYPYGNQVTGLYSRLAFSGARVLKKDM